MADPKNEDKDLGDRRELHDLRKKLRQAEASSARGESQELDLESLIAEVTRELAAKGID